MLRKLASLILRRQAGGNALLKAWLAEDGHEPDTKVTKPYKQVSWVYACVKAIAMNIARVPFKLWRGDQILEEGPLYELFRDVNPYMSRWQLWETTMTFLELTGNAFWILDYPGGDTRRVPVRIWIFGPDRMRPEVRDGVLVGWTYQHRNRRERFSVEEVIHFKYVNPYGDLMGMGPLQAAREAVQQDWWAQMYNRSMFKNSAEPGGVLETEQPLTTQQVGELRKQWEARHRGADKAKRVAILHSGLKWKQIGLSPKDMEFLAARKFNREEICAVFKVPPVEVGIMEYARYANADVQRRIFWETNLIPKLKYLEDKLNTDLFARVAPEVTGEFDLSGVEVLKEDFKEKVETAYKLWQMGVPLNEINEKLDLGFKEVPWGDDWWINMNLMPASSLVSGSGEKSGRIVVPDVPRLMKGEDPELKRREALWRAHLERFDPLEDQFKRKLRRFLWEQRQRVLEALHKQELKGLTRDVVDEIFDLEQENGRLRKRLDEVYRLILAEGLAVVVEETGEFDWGWDDPAIQDYLKQLTERVTKVNDTIKRHLRREILDGLSNRETLKEIADRIRKVYNMASTRASAIARTETCSAIEGGKFLGRQKVGVKLHQWISARDEHVRESHWMQDGKTVKVGEPFPNGLRFPGDPNGPAAEVINCRCTTIAVEEG